METTAGINLLEVKNVSIGYPSNHGTNILFEDINLSLLPGSLSCLIGLNGIGKSTLIRVLAGLQKPLAGQVVVPHQKMALVLTDKITATNMTVFDLVSYGRYPYLNWQISLSREDIKIIERSIEEVGIAKLTTKKIEELSDGQMQLAMIARALAQETPLLLLDEPTAHLDLTHRVEIMRLLHDLTRKKNKTILAATHELDIALHTADEIWLATADKKIKTGIPEDLVLDGSLDKIFHVDGFDLKTGKLRRQPFRNKTFALHGQGIQVLWTKNALEREGFSVSDSGLISITVVNEGSSLIWRNGNTSFTTLKELLDWMKSDSSLI